LCLNIRYTDILSQEQASWLLQQRWINESRSRSRAPRRTSLAKRSGPLRAAIFDFDLTLADSTAAVVACVDYALDSLNLGPVSPEQVRRTIGLSLDAALEVLTGETSPQARVRFHQLFVEAADRVMVAQTEMMEGVLPALDVLRESGLRLGVVSTKYRYRIEDILDRHGARDRFTSIVGAEDTEYHKPDPEGLYLTLTSLGICAGEAVYVGDHVVDAEAAERASVPFVGVLTGTTKEDEFREFPHLGILRAVPQLPSFLDGLSGWPPE
jgi:phosphoglycolate phosphatase